ncbi:MULTISPECIES: HupE/UreJ family protein [unclassified Undibacterium]|uniref:HupE/UreJ family protein n=1 Tax=unclassified Undibacterium TaxID=2630295 RepID=UPI002AC97427|nr:MULTISPECIES: HupE/UreJ family protein [unclassified Undibacterium]MEB0139318.1 HupE/UreJ family protein [Undibacterium sp. CCC2.1]MEB0172162.1 HupE/UreJ family protein [Undibacterium sp. CCC1.1]MEB0176047.1 HupE/UreJ family protein [Undibacterium sp. CCC3.4]MEB0215359.1 HupE/UreJ family protein [Undibacterium sp. 5I2]WPX43434.1 HupE/UreJ family protein [Undibacterium sp. CCC3.4]
MQQVNYISVARTTALLILVLAAGPAAAHVSIEHSVSGFWAGVLHPWQGLDHLLAMLAVGIWAAHHRRPALYLLPLAFPVMMAAGALLAMNGIVLPGIEAGIVASLIVLGLLIAFAIRMPVAGSVALISLFALAHGYAHGAEMPASASAAAFGAGFLLSTATLHVSGLAAALAARRWTLLSRVAGAAIAATGAYLVLA